jgi:polysaccharide deacetylase family protein (PEP-CTERM system associated)
MPSTLIAPNTNFLTLDIEEWYHVSYRGIDKAAERAKPSNLEALVDRMIGICDRSQIRTTCFVLGEVARQKPVIVRKLQAAGHEIASHGFGHDGVSGMTPDQFRTDVRITSDTLEQITGEKVLGYRAPFFSVNRETLAWYYQVLESLGIRYSSSVFPGKTFLYGIPGFPKEPHYPVLHGVKQRVLELPLPVVRMPGSDVGLYPRLWPAWWLRRRIRRENDAGRPAILYLHPREIDRDQPRLPLTGVVKFIHYWGIRSCESKLRGLLADPSLGFRRIADVLPE